MDYQSGSRPVLKLLELPSKTDQESLRNALKLLISRHDAIRTLYCWNSDVQKFLPTSETFGTALGIDLFAATVSEDESSFHAFLDNLAAPTTELNKITPLRLTLAYVSTTDTSILIFKFLGAVYDDRLWNIILHDLSIIYKFCIDGQPIEHLPELGASSASFINSQQQGTSLISDENLCKFWKMKLENFKGLELPVDLPPSSTAHGNQIVEMKIVKDELMAIQNLAIRQAISLPSIFAATFVLLLSFYSSETDVIIGVNCNDHHLSQESKVADRLEGIMPFRIQLNIQDSISGFLQEVHHNLKEGVLHRPYSFSDLARALKIEYDVDYHHILQHTFFYYTVTAPNKPAPTDDQEAPSWPIKTVETPARLQPVSLIDLGLSVLKCDAEIKIELKAPSVKLSGERLQQLIHLYKSILVQQAMSTTSEASRIRDLDLNQRHSLPTLPSSERPRSRSIAALFEEQVLHSPRSIAIVCGQSCLTFEGLQSRSSQIANFLLKVGVRRGEYFAIILDNCIDMIATALASWKIGAPYIPILINETPMSQLASVFKSSAVKFAVTQTKHVEALSAYPHVTLIALDRDAISTQIASCEPVVDSRQIDGDDIAYCNFTSGTTGTPKGVIVPHKGVILFSESFRSLYFDRPSERNAKRNVLMLSKFVTDFSVEQIALGLLSGNKLVMLPKGLIDDEDALHAYLNQHQVTYISGSPLLLSRIDFVRLPHLRILLTCGEKFQRGLFDRMRQSFGGTIYNAYGVTETTMYSVVKRFDPGDEYSTSVGYVQVGQNLYVASSALQLLPPGAVGELFISGIGVTRGYVNLPEHTRQCFLPNPFVDVDKYPDHATIYRTGDLVRFLADGSLEYRGRVDDRIKMQGFRVELEGVRAILAKFPGIKECAVLARSHSESVPGRADFLVAYYTTVAGMPLLSDDIVKFLSTQLTSKMIPDKFFHVEGRLPTGPSGKLDTRRLIEMEI